MFTKGSDGTDELDGQDGEDGQDGTDGSDGKTILNGTSDPDDTNDGVDGDFYINTSSNKIFGPKASGSWPSGVSLVGATGAAGSNAV